MLSQPLSLEVVMRLTAERPVQTNHFRRLTLKVINENWFNERKNEAGARAGAKTPLTPPPLLSTSGVIGCCQVALRVVSNRTLLEDFDF